jgi:hypothetical protein
MNTENRTNPESELSQQDVDLNVQAPQNIKQKLHIVSTLNKERYPTVKKLVNEALSEKLQRLHEEGVQGAA